MTIKLNAYTAQNETSTNINGFESIFNFYYEKVRIFAYGLTKDYDVANEIAQNVFIKMWIRRKEIDWKDNISGYIFTVAKNEINYHFRLKSRLIKYSHNDFPIELESESLTDDLLKIKELNSIVDICIKDMPEQRRRIFTMSRVEMLSNDEIAGHLGISKRTVEKHLQLAISILRKKLNTFGYLITVLCLYDKNIW